MSLQTLRAAYPWPETKPSVPPDDHGWCQPEHEGMLQTRIGPATQLILELGAWLGQSTRLLLRVAPNATVISVDHWKGSTDMVGNLEAERRFAAAYDTFLVNQWRWRDRVIPVRLDTAEGMRTVNRHGLVPDLVYFDAEHTTEHVARELNLARRLFPTARLYGDDWGWPTVRAAVEPFAREHGLVIDARGNAWALDAPAYPQPKTKD